MTLSSEEDLAQASRGENRARTDEETVTSPGESCCWPRLRLKYVLQERQKELKEAEETRREEQKVIDRVDDIHQQKSDPCEYRYTCQQKHYLDRAKRDPRLTSFRRYVQLENGLKVLLISNKRETFATSAASIDVHVGSFSDPVKFQGLAHLCEHVLFTGSETFPRESYSEFLGESTVSTSFSISARTDDGCLL